MYQVERGKPILGCIPCGERMQWGIYAPSASVMVLKIYEHAYDTVPVLEQVLDRTHYGTGDIFHVMLCGLPKIEAYTWQLQDKEGCLSECLLDPYCKGVIKASKGHQQYRNLIRVDSVYEGSRPRVPWQETIIYELHVGHFTKSPSSGMSDVRKGTFLGLMEKLPYLQKLGVTTIELLPVFKWNKKTLRNRHPHTGEILEDEWGYNPIAFFALADDYAVDPLQVREEFLTCVKAIHDLGMEVILDVVYNHTGEGGEGGKVFHFKALGDEQYYKKVANQYLNCSGTGNVLNNGHIVVKNMIIESLRYWVLTFGIDGFRFDLASILQQDDQGKWCEQGLLKDIANDPILGLVKLISESWDAKGSYDVGRMPGSFREWSDFYRDTVRKVVKGDMGLVRNMAQCLVGEAIRYRETSKGAYHSIHFITAHDGFTMWDLVSYNTKHNEVNGENNRDGHNANYSFNHGIEGETTDETILNIRFKCMKNYFALLLLSRGVPMFVMGDEVARTQQGNNNAFCQDNESVWMEWEWDERKELLLEFVRQMIAFRKECKWLKNEASSQLIWHGVRCNEPDWSYHSRSLAWELKGECERYYIIVNNYIEELSFELPRTEKKWRKVIDTDKRQSVLRYMYYGDAKERIAPYSLCVFSEG
ncbi:MAG: alpha-amylase family glycosyl hydrolase [Cellulosilyticaceae bacterium]